MDTQPKNGRGGSRQVSRTAKSPNAFRTISEVADELDVAQHVLRFWESKFKQIKPMKRAGGRRFYRPEDVELLRRIKSLLRDQRYTIEGVQRLLDQGLPDDDDTAQPALPASGGEEDPAISRAASAPGLSQAQRRSLEACLDDLRAARMRLDAENLEQNA